MDSLDDADKTYLLKLARFTIESKLDRMSNNKKPEAGSAALGEKKGCFVTLHQKGDLRGCIGTIEPSKSLAEAVEDNALNAAFRDPRFPPLSVQELPGMDIEISVLTYPKILEFKDSDDLKHMLKPRVHGVILSKGWQSATFLPQVWEQLPDTEMFLNHLCRKAGMNNNCWKEKDVVIKVYQVEYFSEKDHALS